MKHRIVEPGEAPSRESEAIETFVRAGWPADDAAWLAPLCLANLPDDGNDDESSLDGQLEFNLELLARSWADSGDPPDRDRALLMVFARLCGCGGRDTTIGRQTRPFEGINIPPNPWELPEERRSAIAEAMRSRGADFERSITVGGWPGNYGSAHELNGTLHEFVERGPDPSLGAPEIARLMMALVDDARVDLASVVDFDELREAGKLAAGSDHASPTRTPPPREHRQIPIERPRSLINWLFGIGPRALMRAFPNGLVEHRERLEVIALGVRLLIEDWLWTRAGHWMYLREAGPELSQATEPFVDALEDVVAADATKRNTAARRAWLWFAWCTYESDPSRLTADRRARLLHAANEDLASLRKLFSQAAPKSAAEHRGGALQPGEALEPWEEFEWERSHFDACVIMLFQFGGVWRGMKPLLLALRSLATPAVAPDLRYWSEPNFAPPPEPWSTIPASMINMFHWCARSEELADPELIQLRGNLAAFCLERLVDRWTKSEREAAEKTGRTRTNEDMVERSPEWRLCLIRAVASLGVNPEGKGHRALRMSSDIDPDSEVRAAARDAYERLRRVKGLPEETSPRRAVMSALWWIRQAHVLGLRPEVRLDRDGAQRTRIKELSRTKEHERAEIPA